MGSQDRLRLCVVGCGNWSTRMHLPAMQRVAAMQGVDYVGLCELDQDKAKPYAGALGCPKVFNDMAAMLDTCKPEGVVLAVSMGATPELIELAADRQIPFLAEKPPAPTVDVHRRLIDRVGDLPHIVAYNRRHSPYVVRAKDWLGDVPPQSVTVHFARHKRREPDFSSTAVHGIDTVYHLAGGNLRALHIDVVRAGQVFNFFMHGWTAAGTHVSLLITPDTGSAQEHYVIRSLDRNVILAFPQPPMIDVPGYVELQERNRSIRRLGPTSFGLTPDDLQGLGGLVGEHDLFCRVLRGQAEPISTLASTLQTQLVRQALSDLIAAGGGSIDLDLTG